jgi:hypothetical protein
VAAEEGEEGEEGKGMGLPGAVMGMESEVLAAADEEEEASNAVYFYKQWGG